ncbi:hypothetical protein EDB86DRAFT_2828724 [Lactarius hatsudake]|nr:hypothetical protein EDB86DRAFT_2828724 [Lactarius hatsudake]
MVFPDPYPSPPETCAFSPSPDAPKEDDSIAQWGQLAGHAQPEPVEGISFDFEGLDALLAWELGDTLPEPTPASQLGGGLDFDWSTLVAEDMPRNRALDHIGAAPFAATALVPAPPPIAAKINNTNDFLFDLPEWDSIPSLTPALTDVGSVTSPHSDSTGDEQLSFPTYEAAASQSIPSSAIPLPDIDFADLLQPGQAPSWIVGDGINFTGQTQPCYASFPDLMSICGNTRFENNLDTATPIDVSTMTETTSTDGVGVSGTVLGKRRKKSYELPQQRVNPTRDGFLEAAGSTKRARRIPAIGTQIGINSKSKAVERGAGRLASTTARGVYHRSLLGPSVPQGSVGALVQGQPSWTEEREQEETRHDTGSSWAQQIDPENPEIAEAPEGLHHAIPKSLTTWQRLLLQTTQADVEHRAVSVIKCRLCPTEKFKNWACFFRHCRDSEEHPAEIKCCERCGIYFGRRDSMKRHNDSATKACCGTTPDEAAWRKYKAKQLLAAFLARAEYCLRTGEELGPTFAAIARAELPNHVDAKYWFLSPRVRDAWVNANRYGTDRNGTSLNAPRMGLRYVMF